MQLKCVPNIDFSKFAVPLGLFGLSLALAGCNDSPPPAVQAKPFQDVMVRIAAPDNAVARELLERHGRAWADRSGAQVQLTAPDSDADVRVFAPADMGRMVSQGRLAGLSLDSEKGRGAYEYDRLLHYQIERTMNWGSKTYAVPLLGESVFCVYRSDLLEDQKYAAELDKRFHEAFRRRFRAGGPATWQEFALIAEYFAVQSGWAGRSLPPLPTSSDELNRDFNLIASSFVRQAVNLEKTAKLSGKEKSNLYFSYEFDVVSGDPLIDQPGFVAALKFMQRLQSFRPAGAAARPIDAFRAGHAVLAIATLADIPRLQEDGSAVKDKFGICRVPGSDVVYDSAAKKMVPFVGSIEGNHVPYYGHAGWMAGIAEKASHAEAARDLLLYLTSPPVSQEILCETSWGGGPTRSSHLDNRAPWFNYRLSSAHTAQLIAALDGYFRPTSQNPISRLRVPDQEDFTRAFTQRLAIAIEKNQPADAALKDVAQAWRKLIDKDKNAHIRDYALSHGLR